MGEEFFKNLYQDYKSIDPATPSLEAFVEKFSESESRKKIYMNLKDNYGDAIPDYTSFEAVVNKHFAEVGYEELPIPLVEAGNYVSKLRPEENFVMPSRNSQSAIIYKDALKQAGVGEIAELLDTETINGNTLKAHMDKAVEQGRLNQFISRIANNSVPDLEINSEIFNLQKTITVAEATRPIPELAKEAPNPEEDKEVDLAIKQLQDSGIDKPEIDDIKEVLKENKINKARETSVVYNLNEHFNGKLSSEDLDDLFDSIYDKTFLEGVGEAVGGFTQALTLHSVDVIKDRAEGLLNEFENKTGVDLSDEQFDALAKQLANEYDKNTGASEFVGEIAGYVVPLGLTSKVVRGALGKVAPNLAKKVAEGSTAEQFLVNAVETLPADVLDAAFVATDREGNFDSNAFLTQLAIDAGLGGTIGTLSDKFGGKIASSVKKGIGSILDKFKKKELDELVDDLDYNGDIKSQLIKELDIEEPLDPVKIVQEKAQQPEIIAKFKEKIKHNPEQFISDDDLIRDFVNNRAQIVRPSFVETVTEGADDAFKESFSKKVNDAREEVATFIENVDLVSPTIRQNYDLEKIIENFGKENFNVSNFKLKDREAYKRFKLKPDEKLKAEKDNNIDALIKDSWAKGAKTQDEVLEDLAQGKKLTDEEFQDLEDSIEDYVLRQTEPSIGNGSKIDGIEGETIKDQIAQANLSLKATRATGKRSDKFLRKRIKENIARQNEKIKDEDFIKFREENLLEPESLHEIIMRTRGIITDNEALERAASIKATTNDMLNLPKGTVLNKEQRFAFNGALNRERNIRKKLSELIDGGVTVKASTPQERLLIERLEGEFKELSEDQLLVTALEEQSKIVKRLEIIDLGLRSEAGRSLQALKKDVAELDLRLNTLYTRVKKRPALERQAIIEQIIKTDLDDNKKFLKLISDVSEPSLIEKFAEWSVAAKLWNPTTHLVNLGGNALRQISDAVVIAGGNVKNPSLIKADLMGTMVGVRHGLKQAFRALTDEGYASTLSKYIETGGTAPAIGGKLGSFARTPFKLLGAEDQIFRSIAYQRSLYRQAHTLSKGNKAQMKNLVEKPTFEMMDEATNQANRMTFQEDLPEFVNRVNQFRNIDSSQSLGRQAVGLTFRLFVPFLKTPFNLARQSIDFSPIGFLKMAKNKEKYFTDGVMNEEGKRRMGEAIIGSAIIAYGIDLVDRGLLTGGAPKDKAERALFFGTKNKGKLPYAVKINGEWIQYKRIEPFSTVLAMVADIDRLGKEQDLKTKKIKGGQEVDQNETLLNLISTIGAQVEDKTFLQGFSNFMNLVSGEEWERERALKSLVVGSTLPSFVGAISRSIDPTLRETENVAEWYQASLPFVSKDLPARIDFTGNTIERSNKGLNYLFNPIQSSIEEIDPITQELTELGYALPLPRASFNYTDITRDRTDKTQIELTSREFEQYSKNIGKRMIEGMSELMNERYYQRSLNTKEKIAEIRRVRSEIMKEEKAPFIAKYIFENFEGRERRRRAVRADIEVMEALRELERKERNKKTVNDQTNNKTIEEKEEG
jgi:hypothetical protein